MPATAVKTREPEALVVCPFTIGIDTREQSPWGFRDVRADAKDNHAPIVSKVDRMTLKTADYSTIWHEAPIAIEQKEKGDCFHCMGKDRERFERQVQRLAEIPHSHVIVEADWQSVFSGHPRSELKPKVIHRTIISWQQKYRNVHWFLCPTRSFAEATAFRILESYHKKFGQ